MICFYPGSNNNIKEEGEKFVVLPFLVAINFTKLKIILFLNRCRQKFEPIDKDFKYFYPKNCYYNSLRNMGWGSGICNIALPSTVWSQPVISDLRHNSGARSKRNVSCLPLPVVR